MAINIRKILCYLLKANKRVLELEIAIIKGLKMINANNKIRIYYLIIARFTTNL